MRPHQPLREGLSLALLNLLQSANGNGPGQFPFGTMDRVPRAPTNYGGAQLPIAMLLKGDEVLQEPNFGLTKYILHYDLLVYDMNNLSSDSTDATGGVPETRINAMLMAIDNAFNSVPPGERQTLGGLVTHCCIEGTIKIAQPIINDHIVILIPIVIYAGALPVTGSI